MPFDNLIPPFSPSLVCSIVTPATLPTTSPVIFIKLLPLFVIVVAFLAPSFPLIFIPVEFADSLTIFVVPFVAALFNSPEATMFILLSVLFLTRALPFAFITLVILIFPLLEFCISKSPVVILFFIKMLEVPSS